LNENACSEISRSRFGHPHRVTAFPGTRFASAAMRVHGLRAQDYNPSGRDEIVRPQHVNKQNTPSMRIFVPPSAPAACDVRTGGLLPRENVILPGNQPSIGRNFDITGPGPACSMRPSGTSRARRLLGYKHFDKTLFPEGGKEAAAAKKSSIDGSFYRFRTMEKRSPGEVPAGSNQEENIEFMPVTTLANLIRTKRNT